MFYSRTTEPIRDKHHIRKMSAYYLKRSNHNRTKPFHPIPS